MNLLRGLVLGTIASLAVGVSAQADLITGSLPLTGVYVVQDDANLFVSRKIITAFDLVTGNGTGDFEDVVPVTTLFDDNDIDLDILNGFGFRLFNEEWGTFEATGGEIVQQTPVFLDLFITGTFTAGSKLSGRPATPMTARVSINQNGAVLSEAITLNAVPEPSSLVLLGLGSIAGLVGVARRKQRRS